VHISLEYHEVLLDTCICCVAYSTTVGSECEEKRVSLVHNTQDVSGGIVNLVGCGSMDYSE